MALRTSRIFAVLSHPDRLRVFLALLREEDIQGRERGLTQAQALSELLNLGQPAVSNACHELLNAGLLIRNGNTRSPFVVTRPREARTMIRAAALIEASAADSAGAEASELAREMLREEMLRGARESQREHDQDSFQQTAHRQTSAD